jgi:hypothetical protein
MSRRRWVVVLGVGVAVVAAVVVATRQGPTAGLWDGWGCPPEQIGSSVYDVVAEARGSATAEEALRAEAEFQAADGALLGDRYVEALGSRSGPTRYDPETGELSIEGRIYARFVASELPNGTWIVGSIDNCMPPPPRGAEPGPTPG